jgi:hypothetical protein
MHLCQFSKLKYVEPYLQFPHAFRTYTGTALYFRSRFLLVTFIRAIKNLINLFILQFSLGCFILNSLWFTFKATLQNFKKRLWCLSVRRNGSARLTLYRFSRNLVIDNLSKRCWENSSFMKIWQEQRISHMKTCEHFWLYLTKFLFEWEIFRTKVVERIKTHFLCSVILTW